MSKQNIIISTIASLLSFGLVIWFVMPKEKSCQQLFAEIQANTRKMEENPGNTDLHLQLTNDTLEKSAEMNRRKSRGERCDLKWFFNDLKNIRFFWQIIYHHINKHHYLKPL